MIGICFAHNGIFRSEDSEDSVANLRQFWYSHGVISLSSRLSHPPLYPFSRSPLHFHHSLISLLFKAAVVSALAGLYVHAPSPLPRRPRPWCVSHSTAFRTKRNLRERERERRQKGNSDMRLQTPVRTLHTTHTQTHTHTERERERETGIVTSLSLFVLTSPLQSPQQRLN